MAYDTLFKIVAVLLIVAAVISYLATKEFSILFFGLLIGGMACGRFSVRSRKLKMLHNPDMSPDSKQEYAKKWLQGPERRGDRFATNYVTPLVILAGLIIALIRRSTGVFYFAVLLIFIDIMDRYLINKMDKISRALINGEETVGKSPNGRNGQP